MNYIDIDAELNESEETYVEMMMRHHEESKAFVLDESKPLLLYVIIHYKLGDSKIDPILVKNLLKGYNVITISVDRSNTNQVIWMAHRHMVNFILIPRIFKNHQIALIKNQCPFSCMLIRLNKNGDGYERISNVEVKTEPWLKPDDAKLKDYATDRNPLPTYLTLSEKSSDGITGVSYPYNTSDEEMAKWAADIESGERNIERPIDAQGIYDQLIEFHNSKGEGKKVDE